jgi:N-acetylneuraminic acid mutarotase
MRSKLDDKVINIGIWNQVSVYGATPPSREGSAGCLAMNNLFVFGGFSQDLWDDLRQLDLHDNVVTNVHLKYNCQDVPCARYFHTMDSFLNRYLFVFGGASSIIKSINMRLCLNDMHKFDVLDKKWTKM